jgi:hypothetical protein
MFLKGVKGEVIVKVTVKIRGDGGREIRVPFNAKFKRLKVDELKAVGERISSNEINDKQLMQEMLLGWSDLKGADDSDIPFCDEAFEEVMSWKEYSDALVNAFLKQQYNIDVEKPLDLKN